MSYAAEVLADSPLVYYRCGDTGTTSTAVDSSGNGRDGAYHGTQNLHYTLGQTGLLSGDADTAVLFAGGTAYITTPSSAAFSFGAGEFTLEVWWQGTTAGTKVLAGEASGNTVWMGIDGSNKLTLSVNGESQLSGTTTINDGVTHHLVAVRRAGNVYLYVDGAQEATQASSAAAGASNTFGFNGFNTGGFQPDGVMDECAAYATGLSGARVLAHYNAGAAAPPTLAMCAARPLRQTRSKALLRM